MRVYDCRCVHPLKDVGASEEASVTLKQISYKEQKTKYSIIPVHKFAGKQTIIFNGPGIKFD